MEEYSINEKDLVLFVLSYKKKFPADSLERETLMAAKDFDLSEKVNHKKYIREVIHELVGIGLLKEIEEMSGKKRDRYYKITKGGERVYKSRLKEIIKKGGNELHKRIDDYFQHVVYRI